MTATMQPVKRTPLYRTGLAMGATLTDHAGWQVAARFRSPDEEAQQAQATVGLADASWLGKLQIQGPGLAPTGWEIAGATVWPLTASDLLVTCEPPDTPAVRQALQDRAASRSLGRPLHKPSFPRKRESKNWPSQDSGEDSLAPKQSVRELCKGLPGERPGEGATTAPPPLYVTDVTSVYAALVLTGPHSRAVLQRLTALDLSDAALPDLACARTALAHAHATILRQDRGPVPAYWLLVGWEYGAYVWDAVMHAGESSGIAPIGLEALQRLRGAP